MDAVSWTLVGLAVLVAAGLVGLLVRQERKQEWRRLMDQQTKVMWHERIWEDEPNEYNSGG